MEVVGKYEDRSIEVLLKNYKLGKILGVGSTGKVKAARHKLTGHQVAIKILNHRKISKMGLEQEVRREIKIMKLFKHPHIVQLYEVIETPTDTYVVMEYVKSGELFDYIVEQGRLKEDEARRIFQQIICGVEHCHRNMIVHRDLKPENVLLDSNFNVKIADFGFSNVMYDGHFFKTSCGSSNYAAPEVLSGKLYAGPEVDIWSCGVILYATLCGSLPFDNENIPILVQKIKNGVYKLPSYLSPEARNLISSLLLVDPLRRITIPQIRQHPWFQAHLPRYLAVNPISTMRQLQKIDEDVLQKVVMMGFSKDKLVESLHNKSQNEGTVTYYLLLGNWFPISNDYLGSEFQQSMEPKHINPIAGTLPSFEHMHNQAVAVTPQIPNNGKWALGLQARAHPRDIMMKVLKVLQELNVCWKKIGDYNMKVQEYTQKDPISAVKQELEEARQVMLDSDKKLKFKGETVNAAMAARDAAEKSLRLADVRASRLRERVEELTRQLEQLDNREDSRRGGLNGHRYVCWPWQWLGLDFVGSRHSETQQESSNEMELSEPLL